MAEAATILIADDDPDIVQALTIRCKSLGFEVDSARDGVRALLKARRDEPDLLILDLDMPEADGLRVCQTLAASEGRTQPIVILSGYSDDPRIEACQALGARFCGKGDQAWKELRQIISELVDSPEQDSDGTAGDPLRLEAPAVKSAVAKVLLVDDDMDFIRGVASRLRKSGLAVVHATSGTEAFQIALGERPDAIITDYNMPGGSGDYLLVRLKNTEATKHIPVIVVSGQQVDSDQRVPLQVHLKGVRGAATYVRKPTDSAALLAELRKVISI